MSHDAAIALGLRCEGPPAEELEWVRAARSGDSGAVLCLLRKHRPPLVRLLTGITGDVGAAEDLAQEAFLQAFRSLHQLHDPASFYPWVRRLATRMALKRRGRRERCPNVPLVEETDCPVPDPAGRVTERIVIQEILRRLPEELRVTLVLREMDGMDYAEIAATLEVPVGTVRSRLFAARERFRELWRRMEADEA